MACLATNDARYCAARHTLTTLRQHGHQAYFAGGCVRDLLLGVVPKDYDVATSARPEQVQALFAKTAAVGAHFGVVLVMHAVEQEADSESVVEIATEVATFRHDGSYSDGRRPDTVQFSSRAEDDVQRRDFTINGMLLDPVQYEASGDAAAATLDLVGGRADLEHGIVRAIGKAEDRFAEDKLRMLRAVRFAARLGFTLEPTTYAAMQRAAAQIHQVSCERVRDELTRILTEGGARRGMEMLDSTGLLQHLLPEAVRLHGVAQPPEFHPEGDVWTHTMLLLQQLPAGCSTTLAWGALLHDIGKPATFRAPDPAIPGDRIRFNGHVEVGVRIAELVLARLRFSNQETAQIVALVKNHMRFGDVMEMRESTRKRFLRLDHFDEHLALHWLDASSCHGDLRLYHYARQQYESMPVEAMRPPLLLRGDDLIAAGYKPGPRFRTMLESAENAQLEGLVHTTAEALAWVQQQFDQAG
ncbi:MAG: CCA tRNA nucleotidyltransferase [Acidobacteriota bacterium]|nr:CCA tRNA nucleotidyltransferase [Acidobacteriota bacterium]